MQQKISKEELILQLSTAINQFAKRQMTWFRKMEKEEIKINWIDKDADYQNLIKGIELFINLSNKIASCLLLGKTHASLLSKLLDSLKPLSLGDIK